MKQLYELLTPAEVEAMNPKDRQVRLELCEHQLKNKMHFLEHFDAKDYMLKELAGLRANIVRLSARHPLT